MSMGELKRDQTAEILSVNAECDYFRGRLGHIGLVPGSQVKCLLKSGGTSCFLIRDAKIMLRDSDLNNVLVSVAG